MARTTRGPLPWVGGKYLLAPEIIRAMPGHRLYCDPPYEGEPRYRHRFKPEDFEQLAGVLAAVKGQWLLSINDSANVRNLWSRFRIRRVSAKYSVRYRATVHELLISNYDHRVGEAV